MKRFQFRLEKVLRLRRQELDQAKRALGIALAREEAARQAVAAAASALNARVSELGRRERAGGVAYDFALLRTHIGYLQRGLEQAEQVLAEAQATTARRRGELLAARQREKALERLKEKREATYTAEALADEQKELDAFGDRQGLKSVPSNSDI